MYLKWVFQGDFKIFDICTKHKTLMKFTSGCDVLNCKNTNEIQILMYPELNSKEVVQGDFHRYLTSAPSTKH